MDGKDEADLKCVVCGAPIGDAEPAAQTDDGPAHLRCARASDYGDVAA